MSISCIIVEDEPVSQDVLTHYIADIPKLNLVSVCNNAIEASEVFNAEQSAINVPGY